MLFKFNFCSGLFKLRFQSVCFILSYTFFQFSRSVVNQLLGLFQAEAREFLHCFHHGELGLPGALENHVECRFLFLSGFTSCHGTCRDGYRRGCRLDAVFSF